MYSLDDGYLFFLQFRQEPIGSSGFLQKSDGTGTYIPSTIPG
jgi:hypothetical protein